MNSRPFTKQSRLNTSADFKNVFSAGKKYATRYFGFYLMPNDTAFSRLGIIVAKRAIPKAVKRNLFKRSIRESFRLNQPLSMLLDIIVVVYQRAAVLDKKQLREELDKEWLNLVSFYKKS